MPSPVLEFGSQKLRRLVESKALLPARGREQLPPVVRRLADQLKPGGLYLGIAIGRRQDDRLDRIDEARRERRDVALDMRKHALVALFAVGVVGVAVEQQNATSGVAEGARAAEPHQGREARCLV
jgi:hypothetical protein